MEFKNLLLILGFLIGVTLLSIAFSQISHTESGPALGALADELQMALEEAFETQSNDASGAILYVDGARRGVWVGAVGLGNIEESVPLEISDRFRAGSIMKPFVALVILQLLEEGKLSLEDTMPDVLPQAVSSKFLNSEKITIRMLLNHTSGIAEFLNGTGVFEEIVANPARVWRDDEWFDSAAAQDPFFAPGEGWAYSNTDYVLLGQVIEQATGQPWREAIRKRILAPLQLDMTLLPEPGDTSISGNYAHGYMNLDGQVMDVTAFDPSMAGASGGSALVTSVKDLARFLKAIVTGELLQSRALSSEMQQFVDAPDIGGAVGYGLGLQLFEWPGGVKAIGHGGGTAGYRSLAVYLPEHGITIVTMQNDMESDLGQIIFPILKLLIPGFDAGSQ